MPSIRIAPRLNLYYQDHHPEGEQAVLLLHGLGVSADSWQLQVPALTAAGFRVLVPDAPGFGRSTYAGGGAAISRTAGSLANLLQAVGPGPVHVAGISMGGTHALQLTLDYPQLVNRLVLVNTFARLQPDRLGSWLYFAVRFLLVHTLGLQTQAQAVAARLFPDPEQGELRRILISQIQMADLKGYRAAMRALARFNVLARLKEIAAPTLVVTAEGDTTISPQNQRSLVELIPCSRQIFIPNAGHAVIVDQPQTFNRVLLDFLLESDPAKEKCSDGALK